jgi:hypothetical protein
VSFSIGRSGRPPRSHGGWSRWRWLTSIAAVASVTAAVLAPAVPALGGNRLSMSSFSPAKGPVGTAVTLSGSGFVASDLVAFNGTKATVAAVNAVGTKLATSVPALATTGLITVTDPATGQRVDLPNSPFTVTKGIFATPNQVWAGGRFTLEGSGLTPGHTDPVRIETTTIVKARINAKGDFKIGVSVPWDEPSRIARLSVDDSAGSVITILYILGSWPMYRHDPQHTGVDTYETSLSVNSVPALKQLWMKETDPSGNFAMIPSVANGLVYEGVDEPDFFNLDAFTTDGTKMPWSTGFPYSSLEAEPAVTNGNLYYAAAEAISPFNASVNAATGTQNWGYGIAMINSDFPSAPNVVGGRLFVGEPDGSLYAFNASTGVG